ncbi:MAG: V-type ATPase subunit [Phycisphaerae bacterium]|nr:V-type ATPase subunit [Phycisphaerae bacterium]
MNALGQQAEIDFSRYPAIGGDDWEYAFETAQVRAIETVMLPRPVFVDMANAADFEQAADHLRSGEYAAGAGASISELERVLLACRSEVRQQFAGWIHNDAIVTLFKSRDDFANLRLAIRRAVTKKTIGADYSSDGNFPGEQFAEVFDSERYEMLPDYMADAAERAIVLYYNDKDIRAIDYAIDAAQAEFNLATAEKLGSEFLLGLFRIQADLANIRTMLRLTITQAHQRNVFLPGGYVERDQLVRGLDAGGDGLAALFFATPYFEMVQAGAAYAASEKSFLKIEQQCDEYLNGYLRTTIAITAGPQPIIAYLLAKENEIRTVRLVLTAKKNHLNPKLILDRIS